MKLTIAGHNSLKKDRFFVPFSIVELYLVVTAIALGSTPSIIWFYGLGKFIQLMILWPRRYVLVNENGTIKFQKYLDFNVFMVNFANLKFQKPQLRLILLMTKKNWPAYFIVAEGRNKMSVKIESTDFFELADVLPLFSDSILVIPHLE